MSRLLERIVQWLKRDKVALLKLLAFLLFLIVLGFIGGPLP